MYSSCILGLYFKCGMYSFVTMEFFICFAFNGIKVNWSHMELYYSKYSAEMLYLKMNSRKGKKGQISYTQDIFLFKALLFITTDHEIVTLVMLNFHGITFYCFNLLSISQTQEQASTRTHKEDFCSLLSYRQSLGYNGNWDWNFCP